MLWKMACTKRKCTEIVLIWLDVTALLSSIKSNPATDDVINPVRVQQKLSNFNSPLS